MIRQADSDLQIAIKFCTTAPEFEGFKKMYYCTRDSRAYATFSHFTRYVKHSIWRCTPTVCWKCENCGKLLFTETRVKSHIRAC